MVVAISAFFNVLNTLLQDRLNEIWRVPHDYWAIYNTFFFGLMSHLVYMFNTGIGERLDFMVFLVFRHFLFALRTNYPLFAGCSRS